MTTNRSYSTESLPDPVAYYGTKLPYVIEWSSASRALSSLNGDWEAARMTIAFADVEGTLRGYAEARSQIGTVVNVRWVSDTGRAAQSTPRMLFAGAVLDVTQTGDYRFIIQLRDNIAWTMTGITGEDRQIPTREIDVSDFPTAPGASIGQPVPIYFGYVSDAPTDETLATGVCTPIYVGTRTLLDGLSWHEWVVAGHACDRITAIVTGTGDTRTVVESGAGSFGSTWLAAKETGWTTKVDATNYYRRYNGRDYCCLYGRGTVPDECAAGTTRLGVNLKGWTRDGVGGDYISDLYEQWLVFLVNYVCGEIVPADPATGTTYGSVREWQAGSLVTMPTVTGVALVNAVSWYDAKDAADLRIAGGYVGMVALDSKRPIRDVLADFARSAGCRYGMTPEGQYTCFGVPNTTATVAVVTETDVLRESFVPTIASVRDQRNGVLVKVGRYPNGTYSGQEVVGTNAQSTLELPFLTAASSSSLTDEAVEVATRWLSLSGARRIKFKTTPCVGFSLPLGTIFSCDHDAGWPSRVWQVERWSVDPSDYSVEVEGIDVSPLLSSRGVMRAGTATLTGLAPSLTPMIGRAPGAGSATLAGAAPTVTEAPA